MMHKPRLLLIAPLPPPYGGIAVMTDSLIRAGLDKEFDLIHINTSKGSSTEDIGKITPADILHAVKNFLILFYTLLTKRSVKFSLLTATSDTGILRDFWYIYILKLFNKTVLVNLHGTRKYNKSSGFIKFMTTLGIKLGDRILSPTTSDLKVFGNEIKEYKNADLFYNSAYVPSQFSDAARAYNTNKITLNLIGIGRLSKPKGAFDLLKACLELLKENYDIKLTWIGRSPGKEDQLYFDSLIHSSGIKYAAERINVLGGISEEEKFECLKQSDIFVLPTYTDNLPISMLEAMSMGLPVISTLVGEIPAVIENNVNGFLVEPGDVGSLKKTILSFYQNKNLISEFGAKNKEMFNQKFSSQQRIKELSGYIQSCN